jgi:hypothetical protein
MARLIEVQNPQGVSSNLALQVGDVLLFNATGGHIQSGDDVVEMLGAFRPAILGDNGEILTPMGAPNTVLFRALRPGQATIDVVHGDPWHAPQTTTLGITVKVLLTSS